ncbi:hypothetical protein FXO38_08386 [Capsicum annuum]|uniref:fruit-specific protein n=1 Tax=Capsicum annuum TaxID=4072 RepID=UPI0007BEC164|nr:fruit-specific protein [Capsicum annuum]KAF3667858.1 hypothetical protein FXO38_08386 [Capsicum annuum]
MAAVKKFAIFFVVLLAITIVDMCGTSKVVQVTGSSCGDDCGSNSDCGGWTPCQWCNEKTNPYTGETFKSCDMSFNLEPFATISSRQDIRGRFFHDSFRPREREQ